jgi:hypothetical protein
MGLPSLGATYPKHHVPYACANPTCWPARPSAHMAPSGPSGPSGSRLRGRWEYKDPPESCLPTDDRSEICCVG